MKTGLGLVRLDWLKKEASLPPLTTGPSGCILPAGPVVNVAISFVMSLVVNFFCAAGG